MIILINCTYLCIPFVLSMILCVYAYGLSLPDGTSLQDAKIKDGCRLFLAFKTRGIAKSFSKQSSQTSTKSPETMPLSSQVSEVKYGEGGRFHSLLLEFLRSHFNEQDACKVADAVFKVSAHNAHEIKVCLLYIHNICMYMHVLCMCCCMWICMHVCTCRRQCIQLLNSMYLCTYIHTYVRMYMLSLCVGTNWFAFHIFTLQ